MIPPHQLKLRGAQVEARLLELQRRPGEPQPLGKGRGGRGIGGGGSHRRGGDGRGGRLPGSSTAFVGLVTGHTVLVKQEEICVKGNYAKKTH